jgi:tellurite methyltransferase
MDYDPIYKNNKTVFGTTITPLLKVAVDRYVKKEAGVFLDIGAGQGRDSFYMSGLGYKVYALDVSKESCKQIKDKGINNISVINADIKDYEMGSNKYDVVSAINVLQFLKKDDVLKVLKNIANGLKHGGLLVMSTFINSNSFGRNELPKLLERFNLNVLSYKETVVKDMGHPGQPQPHTHEVANTICRK